MQENRCLKLENEELIEELITALGKIGNKFKYKMGYRRYLIQGIEILEKP